MKLCFATHNLHKADEVRAILGETFQLLTLQDIGCKEDLPETQDTIAGNAKQKAEYVWTNYKIPCFADDTGLEVKALDGQPGVFSARYAGPGRKSEDNVDLLLKNLDGVPDREAQFRSVISLRLLEGQWWFEGIVKGTILATPRGKGGFGYDPVFLPRGASKTLAEMTLEEKNQISHRAIAVKKLAGFLRNATVTR